MVNMSTSSSSRPAAGRREPRDGRSLRVVDEAFWARERDMLDLRLALLTDFMSAKGICSRWARRACNTQTTDAAVSSQGSPTPSRSRPRSAAIWSIRSNVAILLSLEQVRAAEVFGSRDCRIFANGAQVTMRTRGTRSSARSRAMRRDGWILSGTGTSTIRSSRR